MDNNKDSPEDAGLESSLNNSPQEQSQSGSDTGRSLLGASSVTGSMTLVSRFLGLARDIVIARLFGTSDAADAFFLANKIPNFLVVCLLRAHSIKPSFLFCRSTAAVKAMRR
jgi:hypothetical protein